MTKKTIADLRTCVDRVIPFHFKVGAAERALAEATENRPKLSVADDPSHKRGLPEIKTRSLLAGVTGHPLKIAFLVGKKWANGRKLKVRFLDGSAAQQERVAEHAQRWSKHANVTFSFGAAADAEIRVSFEADAGSWSAVGTDCLHAEAFPPDAPTMNFGWLKADTDDVEYRRVVLHEFGHALGAIHEHQNPHAGIKWNLSAVYDAFSGPPNNWTKEEIDLNVVQKYSVDQLNATKFDRDSIMLYAFPPELVVGGKGTSENTDLSKGDKRFVAKMYPKS